MADNEDDVKREDYEPPFKGSATGYTQPTVDITSEMIDAEENGEEA